MWVFQWVLITSWSTAASVQVSVGERAEVSCTYKELHRVAGSPMSPCEGGGWQMLLRYQLSDIVSCQIVTTGVESENRLACDDSPVQTDQTLSGISRNTNVAQWDESPMWLMWVRGWWWDSMGSGPHKIFSKVSYFIISNGYNNDRTVWTFLDSINVYLRISIVTRLTN